MQRNARVAYMFLAPALILMMVFVVVPVAASFVISLTDFNIFALADWSNARFIGVDNYIRLFQDELFWKALGNTLYFVAVGVPLAIGLALILAMLLNSPLNRAKDLFRVGYYLPSITETVAIAVVWRWVLNPRYGILKRALEIFGLQSPNWLGDPRWAMPAIIMMAVWKGLGHNALIFLAGLQSIPSTVYEAAEIDGANGWEQFRFVTLPLLAPTTFFVAIMTLIGYLQLFAEPYTLTDGGPLDATLSIVLYMYRHGFKFFNLGYASAMAYVLFALIFVATLVSMKSRAEEVTY
ncbi:MAG: carbohydrate ABC transporter permease [Bacillota bacterium]|jgi:multiple sugar transport system permease protein|nr:sugar ABC transporter permease [Bacillota bacterium]